MQVVRRSSSLTDIVTPRCEDDIVVEEEYYEEVVVTDDEEESYFEEEIIEEQTVSSSEKSPPKQIMPIRLSQRMTMFDAPDLETLEECSVEDSVRTTSSHRHLMESFRKERTITITNLETLQEGVVKTPLPPPVSTTKSGSSGSSSSSRKKSKSLAQLPAALLNAMQRPPKPKRSKSGNGSNVEHEQARNAVKDSMNQQLSDNPPPLPPPPPPPPAMMRPSPLPMRRKTSLDQPQQQRLSPPPKLPPPAAESSPRPPQRKKSSNDKQQQLLREGLILEAGLNDTLDSKKVELLVHENTTGESSVAVPIELLSEETETMMSDMPLTSSSSKSCHSEGTATTVGSTTVGSGSSDDVGHINMNMNMNNSTSSPGRRRGSSSNRRGSVEKSGATSTRQSRRGSVSGTGTHKSPRNKDELDEDEPAERTPTTKRRSTTDRKSGSRSSRSKSPVAGRRSKDDSGKKEKKERKARSKSPVAGKPRSDRSKSPVKGKPRSLRSKSPVGGRREEKKERREGRKRLERSKSDDSDGDLGVGAPESPSSLGGRLSRLPASSPKTPRSKDDESMGSTSISSRRSRSRRSSTSQSTSRSGAAAASIPENSELDDSISMSSVSRRSRRSSDGSTKSIASSTPKSRRQKGEDAIRAAAQRRLQRQGSDMGMEGMASSRKSLSRSGSHTSSLAEESSDDLDSIDEDVSLISDDGEKSSTPMRGKKKQQDGSAKPTEDEIKKDSLSKEQEKPKQPTRKLSLDDLLARLPAEQRSKGPRDAKSTASAFVRSKDKSMLIEKDDDDDCHSLVEGNFTRRTRKDRSKSRSSGRKKERSKSVPSHKHKSADKEKKKTRSKSLKREKRRSSSDESPKDDRERHEWWQLDKGRNSNDDSGSSLPYLAKVGLPESDHTTDSMDANEEKFHESMGNATKDLMSIINSPPAAPTVCRQRSSSSKNNPRIRESPSRSRSASHRSSTSASPAKTSRTAPIRSKSSPETLSPVNSTKKGRRPSSTAMENLHHTPKSSMATTIATPPFLTPSPQKRTPSNGSVSPTDTAYSSLSASSRHAPSVPSAKERLAELESIREYLKEEEYDAKRKEILSSI